MALQTQWRNAMRQHCCKDLTGRLQGLLGDNPQKAMTKRIDAHVADPMTSTRHALEPQHTSSCVVNQTRFKLSSVVHILLVICSSFCMAEPLRCDKPARDSRNITMLARVSYGTHYFKDLHCGRGPPGTNCHKTM